MSWLQRLLSREKLEKQLDKELRFHLEQHTADLMARGRTPEEARREAGLAFGGSQQAKEACRDARGTRWVEDLWRDFRFTLRSMRKRPGFALPAILTLGLGCGATTLMFTIIHGVLFKPMPFSHPESLVKVEEQTKGISHFRFGDRWAFAYPNFNDVRGAVHSLDLTAMRYSPGIVTVSNDSEFADGLEVSAGLFSLLNVKLLGREFRPDDDRAGAAPAVIISDSLWRRHFGGKTDAIGRQLVFNSATYTVVGITPPGFNLRESSVFTPIGQNTLGFMKNREAHPGIQVWGRLRPGATLERTQAELDAIGRGLAEQYPKSNKGRGFIGEPLRPYVGDVRSTLWLLLGAVSLVLLIACVNVASLLLARAISRERELAMRVALGAGRGRLVRQCLTESAVLGLCGGLMGIVLAILGLRPFIQFWPGGLPRADEVQLDWRVMLFALAVSLGCGLFFGLAPALRVPSRDLEKTLRAGARTGVGGSRQLHGALVVAEIALAVVLLVSAGILGRTLLRLSFVDPGLNPNNVLIARMAIPASTLKNPAKARATWDDILDRARHAPGVVSVATVDTVPMREGDNALGYWTTQPQPEQTKKPLALANSVSPDYLKVTGIPLRRGRFINELDRRGSQFVAVIDEVMAHRAFGGKDPIGQRFWSDLVEEPLLVVGVVGHVRQFGLAGDDGAAVREQFYYPFAQVPDNYVRRWSELMSIAVKTNVPPLDVLQPLRQALRGSTGDQVLYQVNTLEQLASASIATQRFLLLLFGVFAVLALVLACGGVYGVLAYLTSQRIPEIGVRMALGASRGGIVRMVLGQSLGIVVFGILLGSAGALEAAKLLGRLVEGSQSGDFGTFASMIAVLIVAALIASFVPARRAGRLDPMIALRQE